MKKKILSLCLALVVLVQYAAPALASAAKEPAGAYASGGLLREGGGIQPAGTLPMITPAETQLSLAAGATADVEITVADADPAELKAETSDAGVITLPPLPLTLDGEGKCTLQITAADVTVDATATITLTAENTNGEQTAVIHVAVAAPPEPLAPGVGIMPAALELERDTAASAVITVTDGNDPPEAVTAAAVSDNEALLASPGALTLDGEGKCTLQIEPLPGQTGDATLTVTAQNASGKTFAATLSVTVITPRTPPAVTAAPSAVTMEDDETKTLAISVADTNSPLLALGEVSVSSSDPSVLDPAATLAPDANGDCLLVLQPSAVSSPQTVTLTFAVQNAAGKQGEAQATVTVTPATAAPRLDLNDAGNLFSIAEDGSLSLDLFAEEGGYLINPDGLPVTLAPDPAVTQQNGAASVTAAGTLAYTPNADHFTPAGQDASDTIGLLLHYTKHGEQRSAAYTLRVKVTPVEDAPLANDDAFSMASTETLIIRPADLLANDVSVDKGELAFAGFGSPAYAPSQYPGSYEIKTDESGPYIAFTPHIRYAGVVTIPYEVKNAGGALPAVPADIKITVAKGANAAPGIENAPVSLSAVEDTPFSFSFYARDLDIPLPAENNLTVSVSSGNPFVLKNDGITVAKTAVAEDEDAVLCEVDLAFEADANTAESRYGGPLELTITVTDDKGASATCIIPVTVAAVNDEPALEITGLTQQGGLFLLEMEEDAVQSFAVKVTDVDMPADVSGYSLDVASAITAVLPNLPANIAVSAPSRSGDALLYTVTLTPLPNANTQQKEYSLVPVRLAATASDGAAASNTETVSLTVTQKADAPAAVNDAYTIDKDKSGRFYVLLNDTDADGKGTLAVTGCGAPGAPGESAKGGTVSIVDVPDGDKDQGRGQYILYTPAKHYFGEDEFTYSIKDDTGNTADAVVKIIIRPVNYPPIFEGLLQDDPASFYSEDEDTLFTQRFTVYDDTMAAGDMSVQCSVTGGGDLVEEFGVRKVEGQENTGLREVWVRPAPDKNSYGDPPGLVVVRLRVSDGNLTTNHVIRLYITPVNDPPTAAAVTLQFDEGQAKDFAAADILKHCGDPDAHEGDSPSLVAFGTPTSGEITPTAADGKITGFRYTPAPYFDGTAEVEYTLRDTRGAESAGTLKLKAVPVNDPPRFTEAPPAAITMDEDGNWRVPLKFYDPETAHPTLLIQSANEEVLNQGGFSYTYTDDGADLFIRPRKDRHAATPFDVSITVSDGYNSVTHDISLTVRPVPDKPATPDQNFTTMESTALEFDPLLLCNDVDDGDEMSIVSIIPVKSVDDDDMEGSETGDVQWDDAKKKWIFTPAPGFVGRVIYTYTVKDSYDDAFRYPETFSDPGYENYPDEKWEKSYYGKSSGQLVFQVGTSAVGPSVRRLPPIIAFAGQEMDPKTLVTKNIAKGVPYTLKVEVIGGPVDPATVTLDATGSSTATYTHHSDDSPPEHTLHFQLKPGLASEGLVRVSVTQDGVINSMSFRVLAHAANKPPVIQNDPIDVSCNEGETKTIDVISLAGITDPENQKLRFTLMDTAGIGDDTVRAELQGDTYVLKYTAAAKRNARQSPNKVSFGYTIADQGGAESTGTVNMFIRSENHNPYTYSFYHVQGEKMGDPVAIGREVWSPHTNDYDKDKRYLHKVWYDPNDNKIDDVPQDLISGEVAYTPEGFTFTANTAGWVTLRYQVYSYYEDEESNGKDLSTHSYTIQQEYSHIHVYVPESSGTPGLIPPRATSSQAYHNEDAVPVNTARHEREITSLLFGDGSLEGKVNVELVGDVTVTDQYGNPCDQLQNVAFEKREVATDKWKYYLVYDLAPNANEYNDAAGNLSNTRIYPRIHFTIKNAKDLSPGAPTASSHFNVLISPVNDPPEIVDGSLEVGSFDKGKIWTGDDAPSDPSSPGVLQQAAVELERDGSAEIRVRVTDPDYPTKSKCHEQINLMVTSSNNLAVQAEACVITPPVGEDNVWTIKIHSFVPDKTTTLSIVAYDESGGASLLETLVHVKVSGENHPPVAKDYYAVFAEDSMASVKVFVENSDNKEEDSDPDGDPVAIVLEAGQDLPGTVRVDGDKITFIPLNDFCHQSTLATNPGTPSKPGDWKDDEAIEIRYHLQDAVGAVSAGTNSVFLHFNPENDAPRFVQTAPEQSITESRPGAITFRVTDVDSGSFTAASFGCSYPEGAPIKSAAVTNVKGPVEGIYTVTVTIVPADYECHADDDAPTPLTLTATDGQASSAMEIGLRISPVNDPPEFADKEGYGFPLRVTKDGARLETLEDTALTFDLADYFIDHDAGDALFILSVSDFAHGTVTTSGTEVTFTPNADYCTPDEAGFDGWGSFYVVVADKASARLEGRVQIYIKPVNDPPVLKAMSYSGNEDEPLTIGNLFPEAYSKDAPVWDVDNTRQELSIIAVGTGSASNHAAGQPGGMTAADKTEQGGAVSIVQTPEGKNWHIRYTPAADFNGRDVFYYTVSDGDGETTQKITVTVTPDADPPRANFVHSANWDKDRNIEVSPDNLPEWSFNEGTVGTFQFRIWDPDGGTVLFTAVPEGLQNSNCESLDELLHGEAITNTGGSALRTIQIKPAAHAYGDFTLRFTLDDGDDTTVYLVPVRVLPVNDAPELDAAAFEVWEDGTLNGSVTARDIESGADKLTYTHHAASGGPAHGAVTVQPGGGFTYTPAANYFGPDEFYIQVRDGGATNTGGDDDDPKTAVAKISVTVKPVNDAPSPPTSLTLAPGLIQGGQTLQIQWTGGEDLPGETKREDLAYTLQYKADGESWTTFAPDGLSGGAVTGYVYTAGVPAGITAGKDVSSFQVRVITNDDGKCYLDGALHETLTPLQSAPEVSAAVKIDSTKPALQSALAPAGWTNANKVTITLAADPGAKPGASAIDRIEQKQAGGGFATISTSAAATVDAYENGTYTFRAYDKAGNCADLDVVVDKLDRVAPTIAASPGSITGKTVEDNPAVTLSFGDPAAGSGSKDTVSGLASRQYQLVTGADAPADDGWITCADGASVTFPRRGAYTLYARAQDNAGNITQGTVGSYTIDNAAPGARPAAAEAYEHSVAEDAAKKNDFSVQLQASDADGDSLGYTLLAGEAKTKLESYGTLALSAEGEVRFTHGGGEVPAADRELTLAYRVSDGALSADSTLTVTLYPVNDAPSAPSAPALQSPKDFYRKDTAVTLQWGAGADDETLGGSLAYEVQVHNGTGWQAAGTVTGGVSISLQTPDGNTDAYRYRVRTKDGNTTDYNRDGTDGAAYSGWVESPACKLDNTAPTASPEIAPDDDPAYAIIRLKPSDGGDSPPAWQSGVQSVTHPDNAGITPVPGQAYTYKVPGQGAYTFTITDNAGNAAQRTVDPRMPADPAISYTATHTRQGDMVVVSWTHDDPGCMYLLDVTYNDGDAWVPVKTMADEFMEKSYAYTVPDNYTGAPDTATMRFRVRAWRDVLQSANWSEGSPIICDSTKPVIQLTPGTTAYTSGNVTVALKVTDSPAGIRALKVEQTGEADANTAHSGAQQLDDTLVVTENNTVIRVTATDACGNAHTAEYTVANIDKTPPAVAAAVEKTTSGEAVLENEESNAPLAFTMHFAEVGVSGMAEMRYAITASAGEPAAGEWQAAAADTVSLTRAPIGDYYVHMYAKDTAGNEVQKCFGPYKIINTLPRARGLSYTVQEGGSVTIYLSAADDDPGDAIAKYTVSTSPADSASFEPMTADPAENRYVYTHNGNEPGAPITFTYTATDTRAGESAPAAVTITVLPVNDPPLLQNLLTTAVMDWNAVLDLQCDLFDPDNTFASQAVQVVSSHPDIIPSWRVQLGREANADPNKGELKLRIRPLADAYTSGDPVRLTLTATDPHGARHSVFVNVMVQQRPRPPAAQDQYYFVVPEGTASGSVHAALGAMGESLTYAFGTPSSTLLGSFSPASADPADPGFAFAASSSFTGGVGVTVPVTITQQNADGTQSTADITLHFGSEAVTSEKKESDQVVTVVPDFKDSAGDVEIFTSAPSLLKAESCRAEVDSATGELKLYYAHEPYRYGRVEVTLATPEGDLTIPILIDPENDAPIVTNTFGNALPYSMMASRMAAGATGSLYKNTSLSGTLAADDSLDDRPPHSGPYSQSYACTSFEYFLAEDVQNGSLVLNADGSYVYTPRAGYTGADGFTVLVSETQGFAENKNPLSAAMQADVTDATGEDGIPLLSRAFYIRLQVLPVPAPEVPVGPAAASPPPPPPAQALPAPGQPHPPAPGAPPAAEAAAAEQTRPAPRPALSPAPGGNASGEDAVTPDAIQTDIEPLPLAKLILRQCLLYGGLALLLWLLLLLWGSVIRVRCRVVDENGEERTLTRRRMQRIHYRMQEQQEDRLRFTLPGDALPPGTRDVTIHFGWLYRRRFYEHGITLFLGERVCAATIPAKKQYMQDEKGIRLLPGDFALPQRL